VAKAVLGAEVAAVVAAKVVEGAAMAARA